MKAARKAVKKWEKEINVTIRLRYFVLNFISLLTCFGAVCVVAWQGGRMYEGLRNVMAFNFSEEETVVVIAYLRVALRALCVLYGIISFRNSFHILTMKKSMEKIFDGSALWKMGLFLVVAGLILHLFNYSDLVTNIIMSSCFVLQCVQAILVTDNHRYRDLEIRCCIVYLAILMVLFGVSYGYCRHFEPHTKRTGTNRYAAVNKKDWQQLWKMSANSDYYHASLYGKKEENSFNLVDVPGSRYTETMDGETKKPAVCTSMTPQGITVSDDYIFISAYCHAHKHYSVIYQIDRTDGRLLKTLVLNEKTHAGGLAYDSYHEVLWVATKTKAVGADGTIETVAGVASIKQVSIDDYNYHTAYQPLAYNKKSPTMFPATSFLTYYSNLIYTGYFTSSKKQRSRAAGFRINGDALTVQSEPAEIAYIPGKVQGMAFYRDKLILTTSYGVSESAIEVYNCKRKDRVIRTDELVSRVVMPQMLEQVYPSGNQLYAVFESGSFAYRSTAPVCMDHITSMRLDFLISKRFEDAQ